MGRALGVLLLLLATVGAGCGRGRSSSTTGSTTGHDFGSNNPNVYSAFGDSLTLGVIVEGYFIYITDRNYPAVLQELLRGQVERSSKVVNRGIAGEKTYQGLGRIDSVLAADRPGFVLIMEGANDLSEYEAAAVVVGRLRSMVQKAKANKTVPIMGFVTYSCRSDLIRKELVLETNGLIYQMAAEEGIQVADTYSVTNTQTVFPSDGDCLHPNDSGYAAIAQAFFSAVVRAR